MRTPRLSSVDLGATVAADRRAATRYFLDPKPISAEDEDGGSLEAQLLNLSSEGVGLFLKVRPEKGVYLRIALPTLEPGGVRKILGKVRNVEAQPPGWRVGCNFCHQLSDVELLSLVSDVGPG